MNSYLNLLPEECLHLVYKHVYNKCIEQINEKARPTAVDTVRYAVKRTLIDTWYTAGSIIYHINVVINLKIWG